MESRALELRITGILKCIDKDKLLEPTAQSIRVSYSPCLSLRYFKGVMPVLFLKEAHSEDSDVKPHC